MGLITGLLGLPLAPLRGTVAIAEQVLQQAEQHFHDPGVIRAQLAEVERQRVEGELSEDEALAWEDELIGRLTSGPTNRGGSLDG